LMQGAGAAMSPALTGSIAGHYSYATAFGVLSVIAIVALMVWWRSAPLLNVSESPQVGESGQYPTAPRPGERGNRQPGSSP
ncbi:hypothetical protein ACOIDJ_32845, partial [Klebsiella pneumoniae]